VDRQLTVKRVLQVRVLRKTKKGLGYDIVPAHWSPATCTAALAEKLPPVTAHRHSCSTTLSGGQFRQMLSRDGILNTLRTGDADLRF